MGVPIPFSDIFAGQFPQFEPFSGLTYIHMVNQVLTSIPNDVGCQVRCLASAVTCDFYVLNPETETCHLGAFGENNPSPIAEPIPEAFPTVMAGK